jgi:hypothetical protein
LLLVVLVLVLVLVGSVLRHHQLQHMQHAAAAVMPQRPL